jgi:hypothetical protein
VKTYTEADMNAAIARVETAKQNHPVGWGFLGEFGLEPEPVVAYAFLTADAHVERLGREEDRRVGYAAGWMNGLGIGISLGRGGS